MAREEHHRGRMERTDTPRSVRSDVERGSSTGFGRGRSGPLGSLMTDPFAMLNAMRHEIDRLFGFSGPMTSGRQAWSPQIETYEKDGKLHICADLPGLSKDDVHVDVNDNMLTIEGERRSEQRDESRSWSERSYGRFMRTIQLPDGINPDSAKASFNDGVLDIEFDAPKPEEKKGRRIDITG